MIPANKQLIEFKADLNNFAEKLNKLNFNLNYIDEYIFDECSELRRIIQLDTEETIASIKQSNNLDINIEDDDDCVLDKSSLLKINNIKLKSLSMINRINKYEKETLCSTSNKEPLIKEFKRLKLLSKHFVKHWFEQTNETLISSNTIQRLNDYQQSLNKLFKETKKLIFNNNIMVLSKQNQQENDHQMNYSLCFKQEFQFSKSNSYELIALKSAFQLLCKILTNRMFLITFKEIGTYNTTIMIYDPVLKKILNQTILTDCYIFGLQINKTLIVLDCFNNKSSSMIIMNQNNLQIIKQIPSEYLKIIGVNESNIFCLNSSSGNELDVYDWSFRKVFHIEYQYFDCTQPFFISNIEQIGQLFQIGCKYYFHMQNSSLLIFDQMGSMLKRINFDNFRFTEYDSSLQNIIALNENKTKIYYFDLNGNLIKEIKLVNVGKLMLEIDLRFLIDENSKLLFYDIKNLLFFS